jgi:hypothetical protein
MWTAISLSVKMQNFSLGIWFVSRYVVVLMSSIWSIHPGCEIQQEFIPLGFTIRRLLVTWSPCCLIA